MTENYSKWLAMYATVGRHIVQDCDRINVPGTHYEQSVMREVPLETIVRFVKPGRNAKSRFSDLARIFWYSLIGKTPDPNDVKESIMGLVENGPSFGYRLHFCDASNQGSENPAHESRLEVLARPTLPFHAGFYLIDNGLTGTPDEFGLLIIPDQRIDLTGIMHNTDVMNYWKALMQKTQKDMIGFEWDTNVVAPVKKEIFG